MKKKITIIASIAMAIVMILSLSAFMYSSATTVKAEDNNYTLTIKEIESSTTTPKSITSTKGTSSTLTAILKYKGVEVNAIKVKDGEVEFYAAPLIKISINGVDKGKLSDFNLSSLEEGTFTNCVVTAYNPLTTSEKIADSTTFNIVITAVKKDYTMIIIMAVLIAAIVGYCIFSFFRNKKKKKETADTMSQIRVGDKVKTIGGICGFITEINPADNTLVIETSLDNSPNKSYIKIVKEAIYQTAPTGPRPTENVSPVEPTAPATTTAPVEKENTEDKKEDKKD